MPPTEFYHGTSLEAALNIQKSGFNISLSGSNAGAALGSGVYITTTLAKALHYAGRDGVHGKQPNPAGGAVLKLKVDLGRCYIVRSDSHHQRIAWAANGYDSAWAAEGVIGEREENCVRDPARLQIIDVILGNTGEAKRHGYRVKHGRLEFSRAVHRKREERQRRENCVRDPARLQKKGLTKGVVNASFGTIGLPRREIAKVALAILFAILFPCFLAWPRTMTNFGLRLVYSVVKAGIQVLFRLFVLFPARALVAAFSASPGPVAIPRQAIKPPYAQGSGFVATSGFAR
eukprot:COSAG03_NODE_345_length_8808_cov_5.062349_6_plen_289_part_00